MWFITVILFKRYLVSEKKLSSIVKYSSGCKAKLQFVLNISNSSRIAVKRSWKNFFLPVLVSTKLMLEFKKLNSA